MKCTNCQTENNDKAKYCRMCGSALNAVKILQRSELQTKLCPACNNTCKPNAKFCRKCGHHFSLAATPSVAEPQTLPILQPEQNIISSVGLTAETKPCPSCSNILKLNAKFCGKCGFNFEQQNSHQTGEFNKEAIQARIEMVEAIHEHQSNTVTKATIPSPSAKVNVLQSVLENITKNLSVTIVAIAALGIIATGGGIYWWFALRQPTLPMSTEMNVSPNATSEAPAQSVAPSLAKPGIPLDAQSSVPATPTTPSTKNQNHKGEETNDDRKLLNAIDEYLDKQKK